MADTSVALKLVINCSYLAEFLSVPLRPRAAVCPALPRRVSAGSGAVRVRNTAVKELILFGSFTRAPGNAVFFPRSEYGRSTCWLSI